MNTPIICPHCTSENTRKKGLHKPTKTQKAVCLDCGRYFRTQYQNKAYDATIDRRINQLLGQGLSVRAIARQLSISPTTVWTRRKKLRNAPIEALVERIVAEQLTPEQLHDAIETHIAQSDLDTDNKTIGIICHEVAIGLHNQRNPKLFPLARRCYQYAQRYLPQDHQRYAQALLSEARVCIGGGDSAKYTLKAEFFRAAVTLCQLARRCFPDNSQDMGEAFINEEAARTRLGLLDIDWQENWHEAVKLCQQARGCFPVNSPDFGRCLTREADRRTKLAKKGIEPIKNLTRGLELCQQAQLCYSPEDKLHTKTLQTKGRINCELVLCGISPDENAQQAMALFSEVRQRIAPNDVLSLATYIHEGEIYQADGLSGNRKENLQKALRAYYHAQQSGNLSPLRNISMVYEQGLVYLALAQLEENPIEHVSSAAFRFEQAKEFLNQEEFGLESIKILLAHALKKLEHIQSSEGLGEELNNIEHLLRSIYTTIYDLAWCW